MDEKLISLIKSNALKISGTKNDYDPIIEMSKNARFVLIGEATHGTEEFYSIRAEITKRLIEELDFDAVAIEGDWPDAYHVNQYVTGDDCGETIGALSKFERFPAWIWRNQEVLNFVRWLHSYNNSRKENSLIGFYGLDLYSMNSSIAAVINYLDKVDPQAAKKARQRYSCLDRFANSSFSYSSIENLCEMEIVKQLIELREHALEYSNKSLNDEEFFSAEQNAILIKDAQQYYRSLYYGEPLSWNLRDSHMAETLEDLAQYIEKKRGRPAKIVVWAHNSHIGDARATEMIERDELNLGQIMREKYDQETLLIGFSTYQGTVTAASDWDAPEECKIVLPAMKGSIENIFHHTGIDKFILPFRHNTELTAALNHPYLQRFIGVIYRPQTEYLSHYYHALIAQQFDAVIYIDQTSAVKPLETNLRWQRGEVDDTYPFGL
jgi:erythromycin esterase-like protein